MVAVSRRTGAFAPAPTTRARQTPTAAWGSSVSAGVVRYGRATAPIVALVETASRTGTAGSTATALHGTTTAGHRPLGISVTRHRTFASTTPTVHRIAFLTSVD